MEDGVQLFKGMSTLTGGDWGNDRVIIHLQAQYIFLQHQGKVSTTGSLTVRGKESEDQELTDGNIEWNTDTGYIIPISWVSIPWEGREVVKVLFHTKVYDPYVINSSIPAINVEVGTGFGWPVTR